MIAALSARLGLPVHRLPLWDERYPSDRLRRERQADPRSYDRGFRLLALTPGETLFPSFAAKCVRYGEALPDLTGARAAIGMDISREGRKGTWLVGGWLLADGTKVITPDTVKRGAWTATEAMDALGALAEALNPVVVIVEDNASQAAYLDVAKANPGRWSFWGRMRGRNTGSNKHSLRIGLPALEVQFGNGVWRVLFPSRHRADCECDLCELVRQFDQYPLGDADDGVMATWELEHGLSRYCAAPQRPVETDPERIEQLAAESLARVEAMAADDDEDNWS